MCEEKWKHRLHKHTAVQRGYFVCDQSYLCVNKHSFIEGIKAVPLQAQSGPEGSRNLRFPDFVTMAQDGGKVVSLTHTHTHTHRPPLPSGNTPHTHFC